MAIKAKAPPARSRALASRQCYCDKSITRSNSIAEICDDVDGRHCTEPIEPDHMQRSHRSHELSSVRTYSTLEKGKGHYFDFIKIGEAMCGQSRRNRYGLLRADMATGNFFQRVTDGWYFGEDLAGQPRRDRRPYPRGAWIATKPCS